MLVKPPIAIVGISNWALDRAKMNRAILISRPDPTIEDLHLTGQRIFESSMTSDYLSNNQENGPPKWLSALGIAFHALYREQEKGREFFGMRDLYALIKALKKLQNQTQNEEKKRELTPEDLTFQVCRQFGGKPEKMGRILELFHSSFFPIPGEMIVTTNNNNNTIKKEHSFLDSDDSDDEDDGSTLFPILGQM